MPRPPAAPLSRRALLRGAAAACAATLAGCALRAQPLEPPPPTRLRLIGESRLPHAMEFQGTTVGGLSAIDYDPASGLWLALSDDRSERQPARFYRLEVDLRSDGLVVQVQGVVTLRQADGQPFPKRATRGQVVDPEALRLLPGGRSLLWTSEGDAGVNQPPALREAAADGSFVRAFDVPRMLQFGQRPGTGPRSNNTFEGLALTPDATTAWVSMEGALQQDGPVPGVGRPGGPCRFTAFDVASGRALRQVAYLPDAVPMPPLIPGGFTDNGVAEILMVDAHRMLVLERAYSLGMGTSMRLYEIDTREASDTLALPQLREDAFRPAAKRFVADFRQLGLPRLDNTEGMCWGPRLPNGHRSLVVVSDDNFSARQITQLAAFDYGE
jgi:hypothetical protein